MYIHVYILARPRTREHAFRRTQYRINRGSRTLPNTTVKHHPNTANTGTHPNTRSGQFAERAISEHAFSEPEHTRTCVQAMLRYNYTYTYIYIYIHRERERERAISYIYIYIERERDRKRERERERKSSE